MLINSIEYCGSSHKTAEPFLKALGCKDDNGLPEWPLPNLKPSSETDFWGWRACYGFRAEIWAGSMKIDGRWANLMIYWVGHSQLIDGGFAVAVFREYRKEEVKYYEWRACDHVFSSKNIGNCLNKYTCDKCGKFYEVDSSG